ncbi:hypothetical protein GCM10009504_40520 [Pseudomonas laurentiana]|uniref:DUF2591 domain-containing protein n=1 Tax=Pseudomonas laurentiana TaxID=2364649 RepID=A0A6I5RMN2_9PSED|nr:phage protein NinX family protein [Pseudomonas laurentiana]NES08945.1 DUF2591 domain-containing protein [Pseudomonas laurentiana]GGU79514.1 hypothetical protein GCM10009504_40520 [Pseudomonas laurentiana]
MTDLIEVKTADLTGAALDWMVAQVEAVPVAIAALHYGTDWRVYKPDFGGKYSPSTDWAVGGPLIEKHHIQTSFNGKGFRTASGEYWCAYVCSDAGKEQLPSGGGGTPLIAACRAIVAAKFVDIAKVPRELLP